MAVIKELYEDIIDNQIIAEFETREKNSEVKFVDSNEIINMLQNQKNDT